MPSHTPGATFVKVGNALHQNKTAYNNPRSGQHLTKTGGRVVRERAFGIILWIQSRVMVGKSSSCNDRRRTLAAEKVLDTGHG